MPFPRAPLPVALRRRAFTRAEAVEAGASRRVLESDQVRRAYRGIYCDAALEDSLLVRCLCAHAWALDAAVSGTTALALLGISLPALYKPDTRVHLTAPATGRSTRPPPGIVFHRFTQRPCLVRVPGARNLFALAPLDAWIAAGQERLAVEELVVLGDRLLDRKRPLVTLDQLHAAVGARRGSPGVQKLRAALALLRPGTDSPMETWVRLRIVEAGIEEPEVNARVNGRDGIPIGHLDMAYCRWRVAVFYDGDQHRTDRFTWYKDSWDEDWLRDDNWVVIRINASHIRTPGEFIDRIRLAIEAQRRRGVRPYRR